MKTAGWDLEVANVQAIKAVASLADGQPGDQNADLEPRNNASVFRLTAAEAVELWFEDGEAIEPRGIDAIRAEVGADLQAGAFLIAVPYVRRTGRQRRVNISLDTGTLDAIDTAAKAMSLTRSAFIAQAAANEIRGTGR